MSRPRPGDREPFPHITVGQLIARLKRFDPETLVLLTSEFAHEEWFAVRHVELMTDVVLISSDGKPS